MAAPYMRERKLRTVHILKRRKQQRDSKNRSRIQAFVEKRYAAALGYLTENLILAPDQSKNSTAVGVLEQLVNEVKSAEVQTNKGVDLYRTHAALELHPNYAEHVAVAKDAGYTFLDTVSVHEGVPRYSRTN